MNQTEYELDQLAFTFFKLFSRFEYALKASGYYKNEKEANPDWDKFAKDIDHIFDGKYDANLGNAVDFLLRDPPKKQSIINGKVEFKASRVSGTTADMLLIYVRRVRNNLFHGGKFNGEWFDPERSEPLLRHSIVVLQACLERSKKVKEFYYSY